MVIETERIIEELMEIWPNEVCDTFIARTCYSKRLLSTVLDS